MTTAATFLSSVRRPSKSLFSLRVRLPQGTAATARLWIPPIPRSPVLSAQNGILPPDAIDEALKAPSGFIPFTNYRFAMDVNAKRWQSVVVPASPTVAQSLPAPVVEEAPTEDAISRMLRQRSGFIAFNRPNPEFFEL